jgi:transcriptional regulator with XRE-family HTH domain
MSTTPTPPQLRAARALLDWSVEDLATAVDMTREALYKIERGTVQPQRATVEALLRAFDEYGVVFTDGDGVRLRRDVFRVIEGPDPYLSLLEDVFMTLRGTGGEVLFFYVDNAKSPQAVIDSDLRMRHDGIRFRSLIDEEKPYCLYPLREYRCIPHEDFHNNTMVVYGNKVGVMIGGNAACHLIRDQSYADTMTRIFERLWKTHKMPRETTAPVTYD